MIVLMEHQVVGSHEVDPLKITRRPLASQKLELSGMPLNRTKLLLT